MSKQTLWQKVVTELRQGLLSGSNNYGRKFPSLNELTSQFGISKITALRVVAELEKEGLVKRIPNRETVITGSQAEFEIKVLIDFKQNMAANSFPLLWQYMQGIEESCRRLNCRMNILSLDYVINNPQTSDRYIMFSIDPGDKTYSVMSESGCRHIVLHSHSKLPNHDSIRIDHKTGGALMTRNMIENGHKRIAYVGGPSQSPWHAPRLKGYLDTLEEYALPIDFRLVGEIASSVPRPEDAAAAMEQFLALPERPTAIVASDDLRAIAIRNYLQARNHSVPENFSLSGMDGRPEATSSGTPITTCDWRLKKQGEMAVNMLFNEAPGSGNARDILVEPQIINGKTVRKI